MSIPFFNLTRQYQTIGAELEQAAREVLASGQYVLGSRVAGFERQCAELLGVKHAVGVASGTDALALSLRALGIGSGDEVITTPFTFFATAEMISAVGAKPVFVDIQPDTFNLDPSRVESAITTRTKALLPVHLFGLCANMIELNGLATKHGLRVIEDAAQAFGAMYLGKRAGALGQAGCFSFFPTKNLGACGDGGLVTTNDDTIADQVRLLAGHGSRAHYQHEAIGCCSRLDALQAALLTVKLRHLEAWNQRRSAVAARYREALAGVEVVTPGEPEGTTHIFHQFTIRPPRRDRLALALQQRGIGTMIYYPIPIHLQEAYKFLGHRPGDFPESERAAAEVLSLPIFPELTDVEVDEVSAAIRTALR